MDPEPRQNIPIYVCLAMRREDFVRMRTYSSRIKKLLLVSPFAIHLEQARVLESLPSMTLFPRLRDLSVTTNSREFDFVVRTLGTELTTLYTYCSGDPFPTSAMSSLAETGPHTNLTRLSVLHYPIPLNSTSWPPLLKILKSSPRIQHLSMPDFDPDGHIWHAVGQLNNLEDLTVNLVHSPIPPHITRANFRSLLSLKITTSNLAVALSFLQQSTFTRLQTLRLLLASARPVRNEQALDFFNALASACSHHSLAALKIVDDESDQATVLGSAVDFVRPAVLRPLLPFRHMKSLEMDLDWSWDLDDKLLEDMAHAWPELEELRLNPNSDWNETRRITFKGLEVLAAYCPILRSFGAAIHGTLPSHSPVRREWRSNLAELYVGGSSTVDYLPAVVAAYLSNVYPSLTSISTHRLQWPNEEQAFNAQMWAEVMSIFPTMVAVREEERIAMNSVVEDIMATEERSLLTMSLLRSEDTRTM
ncbi:hypothetical protein BXZ70DRAFT_624772 [Cristinia sonorae]|uniref:F-box domain-containing protein n=1 Tax=Cristinia sonorae TaxID=1940300 RepID=A0A8K0UEM0_9AGAR|nr:hypothetical protein BXZ70DRAFT_624772 [Cristinia sonorae]